MWVYEGLWMLLLAFSRNQAHPELSLLRAFADYEAAMYTYWEDPDKFSSKAITQFTEACVEKVAAQDSFLGDRDPSSGVEVEASNTSTTVRRRIEDDTRLALHQDLVHHDEGYCEAWQVFISSWYSRLTAQQRQQYDLTRRLNGSITVSAAGVLKILQPGGAWEVWARQQIQAAQEAVGNSSSSGGGSSTTSSALLAAEQLKAAQQQGLWSIWASASVHDVHDHVFVNGTRFAGAKHSRHAEQGWAVLSKEPGISSMVFVEVVACITQATPAGTEHTIVLCHQHKSRPVDSSRPGPGFDAHGLIIFPSAPTFDGCAVVAAPAAQLVPLRLTVVKHMNTARHPDAFVALKRIPCVDFMMAAGYPESSGRAGV